MTYTDVRRWIVAAEIAVICLWGGGLVMLADALSGPFMGGRWAVMMAIWIGIPLAITGTLVGLGALMVRRGDEKAGSWLTAAPLGLLALAAIWAWSFG